MTVEDSTGKTVGTICLDYSVEFRVMPGSTKGQAPQPGCFLLGHFKRGDVLQFFPHLLGEPVEIIVSLEVGP